MARYDFPEEAWALISLMLPPERGSSRGGRPYFAHRHVMNGIFWVLCSGAPWRDLPARLSDTFRENGKKLPVHVKTGSHQIVFEAIVRLRTHPNTPFVSAILNNDLLHQYHANEVNLLAHNSVCSNLVIDIDIICYKPTYCGAYMHIHINRDKEFSP
ncbi:TPA: transposase [Salmonella enterica]